MHKDFDNVTQAGSLDEKLLSAIDWSRLPRHVAIIMDGNGRWRRNAASQIASHRAGVEAVRAAVDTEPGWGWAR
jgi:undecaprenyl diphosphate synthase